ncbi:OLC1v1019281C1 [Oldenlandia corymbosa var. corymbosa]|uniref:OLC1v1019281C1 n=1 Tax=Oldenlandia corymbosa var. corymbosa TaxID=529605 RepID=A0AAV1EDZ6_OLDCO|nr:OLC1v1019281C1 [Oldenlandia corymbosa var. corymbosa]
MKDSWIKVATIPCADAPRTCFNQSVCESRNGEILCIIRTALFLCDPKTNTSRRCPHIGTIGEAIMYVESLVRTCFNQSVCESTNGEILCIIRTASFLYDPKTNTSRRCPHIGTIGEAIMYVESLVPL